MKNLAEPQKRNKDRVRELLAAGLKPRPIALLLGLSTQRIYQIKADLEQSGEEAS